MAFFERRPWGWMIKPLHVSRFWIKLIRVKGRTSLQYHRERDEYWVGAMRIRRGMAHRMTPGFYLECALGNPREDDIVRIEDDYQRGRGKGITVAVSGGFDPVHSGHIDLLKSAKKLGDHLIVFLNSDEFLTRKKGKPFMPFEERKAVLDAITEVDETVPVVDFDDTVCDTLRKYKPHIFANGGDRTKENIPEMAVCEELGIRTVFGVGGGKRQSSSSLLRNWGESSDVRSV